MNLKRVLKGEIKVEWAEKDAKNRTLKWREGYIKKSVYKKLRKNGEPRYSAIALAIKDKYNSIVYGSAWCCKKC